MIASTIQAVVVALARYDTVPLFYFPVDLPLCVFLRVEFLESFGGALSLLVCAVEVPLAVPELRV